MTFAVSASQVTFLLHFAGIGNNHEAMDFAKHRSHFDLDFSQRPEPDNGSEGAERDLQAGNASGGGIAAEESPVATTTR